MRYTVKIEYLPTMAAFVVLVLGISYMDVPMWFKVLVVVSGLLMMIFSGIVIAGLSSKDNQ